MERVLAACVAASLSCANRPRPDPRVVRWQDEYADAASELCAFVRSDMSGSNRVREWAREHPQLASEMLEWAAQNPGATNIVPAFLNTRGAFSGYRPAADAAIYSVLYWASLNPQASRDLATVPRGLAAAIDPVWCP